MQNRVSSSEITELKPNEVFVFGSNLLGIHGGGAARVAHVNWGAVYGQGEGIQGNTYAIPTKASPAISLDPKNIERHVLTFIEFAKANPHKTFLVTEIGCGLAMHSPKDIAPMFKPAIDLPNVYLPVSFWNELTEKMTYKGFLIEPVFQYESGEFGFQIYPDNGGEPVSIFRGNLPDVVDHINNDLAQHPETEETNDEDDFKRCSDCDGHDACADFGCAIKAGLGHILQKPI